MEFEKWMEEMKEDLERFEKCWREHNKTSPNFYPMQMNAGDWDEQFTVFQEEIR